MADLILGISAYYHDSAAALVRGSDVVAAAQEERFTRRRHDRAFPSNAIRACLELAGARLDDVAAVAFYEDSRSKFARVLHTFADSAPHSYRAFRDTMPDWLSWKLDIEGTLAAELRLVDSSAQVPPIHCGRHHYSHAASAFFPSPFESAAVLCVDGVGERATTSLWHGQGSELTALAELHFPHSLGLLYSAFTYFCGFKVDSGEYKLMGLAPYGEPRYADLIRDELIDVKPDGSFRLNAAAFEFMRGRRMTGERFEQLFGGPRREPESALGDRELDLAASVQAVTEEVMGRLARTALERTGESRLCLAGGVALNCVANGRLLADGVVDQLWVQPAAGDSGGALGAALGLAAQRGARRVPDPDDGMQGALLGPEHDDDAIGRYLEEQGAPARRLAPDELDTEVARGLAGGAVVGWFQGRMEFGPRALGARSILGDPRDPRMQSLMNVKIKGRESFRPFAPAVLEEDSADYFDLRGSSPYMLVVADVAPAQLLSDVGDDAARGLERLRVVRSRIPAVTHVDRSARVQTVSMSRAPRFHRLLTEFKRQTGCSVLVNTSFNVRGEPIVNTPADAYRCFMRTDIDLLALGGFLLRKRDQPTWKEATPWRELIPMD